MCNDIREAVKILNINDIYNIKEIKQKYKTESRKTHPDRGGDPLKFIQIKDAYDLLVKNSKKPKKNIMDDIDVEIFRYYLFCIQDSTIFHSPLIEKYVNYPIYEHLSQYKNYEITPTLNRIIKKEIFYMNDHDIYIPLWHHEIVFYEKINITIIPILQSNVSIEDNNDILITGPRILIITGGYSLELDGISFSLSEEEHKNKCLPSRGMPRIKNNIYDITDISDIKFT